MADALSPGTLFVVGLVAAIFLAVMGLGLVRRILLRIAARNAWRHRRSTALAIVGLMIGTAMISSAFAIGDSFRSANRSAVFDSFAGVDERIVVYAPSGDRVPFNETVAVALSAIQGGAIEGVAPALIMDVSVIDETSQQGESRVNAIAFDPAREAPFGPLTPGGFDVGDLPAGGSALNFELAKEMGASEGDALRVFFRDPTPGSFASLNVTLRVSKILDEKPQRIKANYMSLESSGSNLFLPLDEAQTLFGLPGKINEVRITNSGGIETGIDRTGEVFAVLLPALNQSEIPDAEVQTTQAQIQLSDENSDSLGQLFFIFSMFTVIAGVMLIFLIFVLVALERKPEMGMARAVGMTRGQLVQSFLFEGTLYSFAASAVGAAAGIAISIGMLWAFGGIFIPDDPGALLRFLTVKPDSVALAFGAGFLITFFTIFVASFRVSRLNIIRAIRGIPEPTYARSSRKQVYAGLATVALGVLVYAMSWGSLAAGVLLGPSLVFLGAAPVLRRRLSQRASYSVAGLLVVVWDLYPGQLPGTEGATANIEIFIVAGVLAVMGGVLIAIFNSAPILGALNGLLERLGRSSAVLKIATTYPVASAFRTALVMAMVGLVVFTVTVVSVFGAIQFSNIDGLWEDQAGEYDVAGYATVPITNLSMTQMPPAMANFSYDDVQVVTRGFIEIYTGLEANGSARPDPPAPYAVIGLNDSLMAQARFSLFERDLAYATDEDAWAAMRTNASLAIADRNVIPNEFGPPTSGPRVHVGEQVIIAAYGAPPDSGAARTVKVIGVMNQQFFLPGIFVQQELSKDVFSAEPVIVLVDAHDNGDAPRVKLAVESSYLLSGMQAIDTREIILEVSRGTLQFFVLIEVFMGLGLIVGIAGLGIVMLRNVRERRQSIGVLRAIGFQTRMVLSAFVIEASFIAILGLAVGLVLGLILAYEVWDDFFRATGAPFVVAWDQLVIIVSMAYLATLLSALAPALQASRMPVAEALRSVD